MTKKTEPKKTAGNGGRFGPGNPGKPKGAISAKTRQWEALGEAITTKHTDRFNEILAQAPDPLFVSLYLQTLEYFKPKLGRTEHTAKDGDPLVVRFIDAKP